MLKLHRPSPLPPPHAQPEMRAAPPWPGRGHWAIAALNVPFLGPDADVILPRCSQGCAEFTVAAVVAMELVGVTLTVVVIRMGPVVVVAGAVVVVEGALMVPAVAALVACVGW